LVDHHHGESDFSLTAIFLVAEDAISVSGLTDFCVHGIALKLGVLEEFSNRLKSLNHDFQSGVFLSVDAEGIAADPYE
jgi:hypothetical protein